MHIGYNTVGDYEQHKIMFSILKFAGNGCCVGNDWSEIGGTIQSDALQPASVMIENFIRAFAIRMAWVAIQWELMADLTVWGELCTETFFCKTKKLVSVR